jgi:Raf kinase inhibitor-like YbhB/YbcL family protein
MNGGRCLLIGLVVAAVLGACGGQGPAEGGPEVGAEVPASLSVSSPAFGAEEPIPAEYSCQGANVSPPLTWSGVPEGAASLVLIVDDPDAPGGTWVHWVLYDLGVDVTELPAGVAPDERPAAGGTQGENDFGELGYGGPCPPGGKAHRYFFKLYALDRPLQLAPGASNAEVLEAAEGHILARGELMGTFER